MEGAVRAIRELRVRLASLQARRERGGSCLMTDHPRSCYLPLATTSDNKRRCRPLPAARSMTPAAGIEATRHRPLVRGREHSAQCPDAPARFRPAVRTAAPPGGAVVVGEQVQDRKCWGASGSRATCQVRFRGRGLKATISGPSQTPRSRSQCARGGHAACAGPAFASPARTGLVVCPDAGRRDFCRAGRTAPETLSLSSRPSGSGRSQ